MPKISIIIPTFNSTKFIKACLDSVFIQDFKDFEVILVDNGSTDNNISFLREHFPSVRFIENSDNLGACRARNQGIELAQGQYILALDCDVTLQRGFLARIIEAAEENKVDVGMVQPKILHENKNTIYSAGISLSRLRRFFDIGRGAPDNGRFNSQKYIFGACSAAALYNRQMLENIKEKTGYFDERFFFLVEDVDLSWRAQKRGWKALYYPEAVCHHLGNSSNTTQKIRQYLCFRNRYYSIIKNEKFRNIFTDSLLLFPYDSLRLFYLLFKNHYISKAIKEILHFTHVGASAAR